MKRLYDADQTRAEDDKRQNEQDYTDSRITPGHSLK